MYMCILLYRRERMLVARIHRSYDLLGMSRYVRHMNIPYKARPYPWTKRVNRIHRSRCQKRKYHYHTSNSRRMYLQMLEPGMYNTGRRRRDSYMYHHSCIGM